MIARRLLCTLGLASTLVTAAVTPAHAAAAELSSYAGTFSPEMASGYSYQQGFGAQFIGGEADASLVRAVLTLPPSVSYDGPGELSEGREQAGPCEQDGVELTCRVTRVSPTEPWLFPWVVKLRVADGTPVGTPLPFKLVVSADGLPNSPITTLRQSRVGAGADLGLSVKDLAVGEDDVAYTVVVHNNGPMTTDKFTFHETHAYGPRWPGRGVSAKPGLTCRNTSGKNQCTVRSPLAPGDDYEVRWTVPIPAGSPLRGTTVTLALDVFDSPSDFVGSTWIHPVFDATNDKASLTVSLPLASPSPSVPAGPPTGAPAPGVGLPITGTPAGGVAVAGLTLLAVGAFALLVGRRRKI
ncbi:hypothetical protein M1L60_03635 [Actinoplanes sp. TRM 88003]|uniref:Gram-positive cocci surface proteins LPxTG domain-containing protein n=1 Tax=Paractinoplanes aksuensis TaxID=2939490 RepID=A0ABT1DHY4_9ACTN|nr:hypothetical protein [Actinoplanes aksuensis]MCO8269680.1 hypothetical protein [Actinoplanes aksuensis]